MAQAIAKMSRKNQLVLPKAVREHLGVRPGDTLVFDYGSKGVRIEKAANDPFASFREWDSEADDEAYRDL